MLGLGLRRVVETRRRELASLAEETRREDRRRAAAAAANWEGDASPFGRLIEPAAEALAEARGIAAGQRVLDVHAGDEALASAAAGRGAHAARVHVTEATPLRFEDGEFDSAVSLFGAIHVADARWMSAELSRVLRAGGGIGVAAWAPTGFMGRALNAAAEVLGRRGTRAAARWGRYEDAYRRFGFHAEFEVREEPLVIRFPSDLDAVELLLSTPGPLRTEGDARAALHATLRDLAAEHGAPCDGGFAVESDYVIILARKPG